MDKLVSIITPCYNGEKYIQRFLDSVLNQTYNNIELIVVNDGSTDATLDILYSYRDLFVQKKVEYVIINQENKGQSEAINQALKVFKGDYFAWPDSDDILAPEAIQKRVDYLEKNPEMAMVRCRTAVVNEMNLMKVVSIVGADILNSTPNTLCADIILGNVSVISGSWLVRSEALLDVLPFRNIQSPREIGQNYQILIPLTYKYKCGYIDDILYTYVVRASSHSHAPLSFEKELRRYDIAKEVLENIIKSQHAIDENFYLEIIKERYHRWILEMASKSHNKGLIRKQTAILKKMGVLTLRDRSFLWRENSVFFRWLLILKRKLYFLRKK